MARTNEISTDEAGRLAGLLIGVPLVPGSSQPCGMFDDYHDLVAFALFR